jgi:PAS domain S-box-containing protein
MADVLKQALSDAIYGFRIVHHTNGEAALADAETSSSSYDAAVVSNSVDDAAGLQICHRLQNGSANVPAIFLFDLGEEDDASAAVLAGVENILARDELGGYLKVLPGMLERLASRTETGVPGSPERLAVIVQSDPKSAEYRAAASELSNFGPFWRALLESPFEYVLLVDTNATIQFVNRMAPGLQLNDLIGKKTCYDFVDPAMHDDLRENLRVVFQEGRSAHYETYAPSLDRWYANTAGPVYDKGKIVGASVFAREITEQKKIENQLGESERRFRKLAESIQDVFYILDVKEFRAEYVSPAYEDIYGRPVSELYNNALAWMDSVHPDDREWVEADFAKMSKMEEERCEGPEYRIVLPDGTIRWLYHRAFIIKDANDAPTQFAGTVTDVTTAKEAEDRLRESEQKYRTLISQASDGIAVTDQHGKIVEANDSACEMLGYSRDELLGLGFRDIVSETDFTRSPLQLDEVLEGKLIRKERVLIRKDGSEFHAEGSFKAMPDGKIQAIIRDITERKRAEDELRRAHDDLERRVEERTEELRNTIEAFEKTQRLASIGTLAAGIAHEINNPIGSILMAADSALYSLDNPGSNDDAVEALVSIKNDARRAGQIVKTVLQLSRQEISHKWACDLAEVARRARDLTRRMATQKEVDLQLEIEDELPNVYINPTEIEQVFINVINNAVESSQKGQTVWVRSKRDVDGVLVEVEDNGRGMTREETGRIFDPFYTTRQTEGGTGLGLSITYSIVRQHNGTIDVDSQPGKGTIVSVRLPVAN